VRGRVRREPNGRPAVVKRGELELDPAAHTITCRGTAVDLSPREFALIEFLMRSPGEVLRRERILEHVWDYPSHGGSNVVDVYVGYLRRKLEEPSGPPLIRTVRGVGYTLEPQA